MKNLDTTDIDSIRLWLSQEMDTDQCYCMNDDVLLVLACRVTTVKPDFVASCNTNLVCTNGWARCLLDGKEVTLTERTMLVMLSHNRLVIQDCSDDFVFDLLMMSQAFSGSLQIQNPFDIHMKMREKIVLQYDDQQWAYFLNYEQLVLSNLQQSIHPHRGLIIRKLIELLFYQISFNPEEVSVMDRTEDLSQQFIALLNREYTRHHDIAYYADRLCVTAKYLSECIKKKSGKTACQWIDSMVIRDAERMLSMSTLSVLEISTQLGFDNPSAFGKYFKRNKGISPRQFRFMTKG